MRVWIVVALCLGCLLPLSAVTWVAHPTTGAIIYTAPGQSALATELGDIVASELPRVAHAIGLHVVKTFPIYAYTDQVAFFHDTGLDPGLEGASFSPSGTIHLNATDPPEILATTLCHEMTHTLIGQRLGPYFVDLPTWVNEGIAGYLSSPLTHAQLVGVSRLVHADGTLSIEELEVSFTRDARQRGVAYQQSRSMIAWLEYRHPGAVARMLDGLAHGETFEAALHAACGLSSKLWVQQWQAGIPRYLYWIALANSTAVYAPLAVLVFIIALIRARRKRQLKEEEDDAAEPPADGMVSPDTG